MENQITKGGLEKLKKEFEELKTVKRMEVAEKLKHAISFGDLSENAAYSEAKEAQQFLEHRIAELSQLIKNAVVVEEKQSDKVQIGSAVIIAEVLKEKSVHEEKYIVVGATEADPLEGKISPDCPLGRAMMGRKAGDTFNFETPGGKIKYLIVAIN